MVAKRNGTVKTVGIVLSGIVALLIIVGIAIPDTTAIVGTHNDSTCAHPDIRKAADSAKVKAEKAAGKVDVLADSMISMGLQLQVINEKLTTQDKKLDKILEKLDSGG
jgi:hypothetical protein